MNWEVLAYLIMSDGNFDKGRNRIRIYTNSFHKDEVLILANATNNKLGIYSAVLHDRKDQYIITIGSNQFSTLRENILPFMHTSMYYRIGM